MNLARNSTEGRRRVGAAIPFVEQTPDVATPVRDGATAIVRSDSLAAARRRALAGLLALSLLTLTFQAAYIFVPDAAVVRSDGYDSKGHELYFNWVMEHPFNPFDFRQSYTWVHFPGFYQWNAFVCQVLCRYVPVTCSGIDLKIAWFLQAGLRLGTLVILLGTFYRLFRSANLAIAALVLCATTPRVFFATSLWNQDEYVFFFAAILMYVTVAAIQDGLTVRRLLIAAVAPALGFHFKLAMLLPTAAMIGAILLLPAQRASVTRKAVAIALVGLALVVLNWSLFTTSEGLARVTWMWRSSSSFYQTSHRNVEFLRAAYFTVNPGPILRPEPVYVRAGPLDWSGRNSTATVMFLSFFELYDHFQGPARTWLNLLCVWTGTPLLALICWRAGRALFGLLRSATLAGDEVYCAAILLVCFAGLVRFSLGLPFGWSTHPEYVLAAYPAAAVLLFRQLLSMHRRVLVRSFAALVVLHVVLNLALLVHIAEYKITISM